MSVVNRMLRDLESREQTPVNTANYLPAKPRARLPMLIIGVSALVLLIASYLVYLAKTNSPSVSEPEATENFELQRGDQYALNNKAAKSSLAVSEKRATAMVSPLPQRVIVNDQLLGKLPNLDLKQNDASLGSAQFNVTPSDGAESVLSNLRAKAHFASQQNNDNKVIAILHEILLVAPQEVRTRKQLAALLFSKEQFAGAQQVLLGGIQYAPADSSLRLMLSRIFFKNGDNQQAFNILASHPQQNLANDELISFRAALAEKIGQYALAQQDYQVLVQRNPKEAKWWLGLGVSQDKQKMNEQAISSYQQAQLLNQLPQQVSSFVAQRIQFLARPS